MPPPGDWGLPVRERDRQPRHRGSRLGTGGGRRSDRRRPPVTRRDQCLDGRAPRPPVSLARRAGACRDTGVETDASDEETDVLRRGDRGPQLGDRGPTGDRGWPETEAPSPGGSTGSAAFRQRCRALGHPRRDRGRTACAARRPCRRSSRSRPLGGRQRPLAAGRASSSGPCWAGQDRDGRRVAPAGMPRRPLPRAARR